MQIGWVNLFGVVIVVLMLIPNCIYAIKNTNQKNMCQNKLMNLTEQVGRYGCMVLMAFSIGIDKFGFPSVGNFLIYLFGNCILLVSYWVIWALYFYKKQPWKEVLLAVIPAIIFILNGITLRHYLLLVFAIIFAWAHIYVTVQNMGNFS